MTTRMPDSTSRALTSKRIEKTDSSVKVRVGLVSTSAGGEHFHELKPVSVLAVAGACTRSASRLSYPDGSSPELARVGDMAGKESRRRHMSKGRRAL